MGTMTSEKVIRIYDSGLIMERPINNNFGFVNSFLNLISIYRGFAFTYFLSNTR